MYQLRFEYFDVSAHDTVFRMASAINNLVHIKAAATGLAAARMVLVRRTVGQGHQMIEIRIFEVEPVCKAVAFPHV
jgi:hypothetical protein